MKTRAMIIAAAFALAAAAGVNAQNTSVDKAFTANGQNCLEINWSAEADFTNVILLFYARKFTSGGTAWRQVLCGGFWSTTGWRRSS